MTTVGIVTGAASGMGLACAHALEGTVDHLLAVDLNAAALDGVPGEAFPLDVTDADALAGLADRVRELGTLRSVAHAAGISPTMSAWDRIFAVDLVGTALLAEALRPLTAPGTAYVFFASMAGSLVSSIVTPELAAVLDDPLAPDLPGRVRAVLGESIEDPGYAYGVAKNGVQRFARKEAVRLGPLGGRANSLSPGMIDTPMGRQEFDAQPHMHELLKLTPAGRTGRVEELVAATTFLLSDAASYVTGTDLLTDGGTCAAVLP